MIVDHLGESQGRGTNRMMVESSDFILVHPSGGSKKEEDFRVREGRWQIQGQR